VVIPEELEITVQIFAHILHAYHVPLEEVQKRQRKLRTSGYAFMRRPSRDKADTRLKPGDRILLIGTPEAFAQAVHLFHSSKKSPNAHKKSSRHG